MPRAARSATASPAAASSNTRGVKRDARHRHRLCRRDRDRDGAALCRAALGRSLPAWPFQHGPPHLGDRAGVGDMSDRRLSGKIANAPLAVRDAVNEALRDGQTYEQVIAAFPDLDLNPENLRKWMREGGGHARWLKEKRALDDMKAKREFALRIVQENEGSQIHEAGMQIAASQIYEL